MAEKELKEAQVQMKACESARITLDKEIEELRGKIEELVEKNDWIIKEKLLFGVHGGEFDFENVDIDLFSQEFSHKKAYQDAIKKRVNENAYAMFEPVEQKFKTLIAKRSTLENDKGLLIQSMDELDQKRSAALNRCFNEVNANLGKIFGEMLPGCTATMKDVTLYPETPKEAKGVEISVCFSNVWKESLFELSGGQRSLLALAFLFANLRYRPAPFYLLDEIDSALDLSHTENIGAIISSQFPESQFILISLKEGMYNNANTLFKVSFMDGSSKVEKFVQKPSKRKRRRVTNASATSMLLEQDEDEGEDLLDL